MHLDTLLSKRLKRFQPTSRGWYKALCPFHDDRNPSFFVNVHSGYNHCFACGHKGWLQELLDKLNLKTHTAKELLPKTARRARRDPNEVNFLPNYILASYRRCPTRLLDAGFRKDLLKDYDIGFDNKNYRITFPIRSLEGQLAAVSGRNLFGEPKYQIYESEYAEAFPEYRPRPKDHLWNLDRLYRGLEGDGINRLFIVEGYKACLWLIQHGYPAVASMGTVMTEEQMKLVSLFDVPVVLFLDNDEAGRKATVVNYLALSKLQFAKVVKYPEGKMQPDDLDEDTLGKTLERPLDFIQWYKEETA